MQIDLATLYQTHLISKSKFTPTNGRPRRKERERLFSRKELLDSLSIVTGNQGFSYGLEEFAVNNICKGIALRSSQAQAEDVECGQVRVCLQVRGSWYYDCFVFEVKCRRGMAESFYF
ncbi:uncharacterized protein LOC131320214 isoform X3 [Rhododendron vialii]|uniref:uncharacterized protein LOC131320214 isoform X3 n=1 Tax=Rhododendron vialii TaxID=182163 RepID=UPI00265E3689|nr:uncharacterized protein LOC131320214 isoform X3 [Rhododendron vialii]